jgi:hypothetical protein
MAPLELVVQRRGSVSIGGYEPDGSRATIVAGTVSRRGGISEDGRRQAQPNDRRLREEGAPVEQLPAAAGRAEHPSISCSTGPGRTRVLRGRASPRRSPDHRPPKSSTCCRPASMSSTCTSRWMRTFVVLASGTRWNVRRGWSPERDPSVAQLGSSPCSRDGGMPSTALQNEARRAGSAQSIVSPDQRFAMIATPAHPRRTRRFYARPPVSLPVLAAMSPKRAARSSRTTGGPATHPGALRGHGRRSLLARRLR